MKVYLFEELRPLFMSANRAQWNRLNTDNQYDHGESSRKMNVCFHYFVFVQSTNPCFQTIIKIECMVYHFV